jgi:TonB family protein
MRCAVVLLASAMTACAAAQKTEDEVRARLVKQPLYLRWRWYSNLLVFDGVGNLQGKAERASFTLSGVEIRSVKLTATELDLDGQRVGLEFSKDVPKRVRLPEKISIRILAPMNGDYTGALDAIFATNIAGMLPLPDYWKQFAEKHLLSSEAADQVPPAVPWPNADTTGKNGKRIRMPMVVKSADPRISGPARELSYSGVVLVHMIVGQDGVPSQLQVARPAGLGLDEQAIAAVANYRFSPAILDDAPIAMELYIQVTFETF